MRPLHSVAHNKMIIDDFNTAKTLQATISKIDDAQAKIALTGSKIQIEVVDAQNNVRVTKDTIIAAIGQTAYNTLIANTLTALNTAITGAETTANTAFTAL